MVLPHILRRAVEAAIDSQIVNSLSVGGGDISNATKLTLLDKRQVLVKWRKGLPAGMFTAEKRGLELLRSAKALRIPTVLAQAEADNDCPAFIAMEWLGQGEKSTDVSEQLGVGLAALHRVTADKYGLDHDNFIGANPQPNQPASNWVGFFREQRLVFQMELAGQNGRLPPQRANRMQKLLAEVDNLLPAHPPASLLHGDLWGGNWLNTNTGNPALIDPAVYYGHREAELAFTELFGGFFSKFYAAYNQAWPLDAGYKERKELYNLYHLLNHLNLFGEGYGGGVDEILKRYI